MSLKISNLSAEIDGKPILKNINFVIKPGEIHALMGPNGSGKSTLAHVLMGRPFYKTGFGEYTLNNIDLKNKQTDEIARSGLYLAFQNPVAIPGVTVTNLLQTAYIKKGKRNLKMKKGRYNPALTVWELNELIHKWAKKLKISEDLLQRGTNDGFSGGERKKIEILIAAILQPKYLILDEIDTGLDVDALKIIAGTINDFKKNGSGIIIITHYSRILKYAIPDKVHVLIKGQIVKTGDKNLADKIERKGYKKLTEEKS